MEKMKIDYVNPGLRIKFVPTEEQLEECVEFGREFARKVKELVGE